MVLLGDGFQAQEQSLVNKAFKLNERGGPELVVIGTTQAKTCLEILQGLARYLNYSISQSSEKSWTSVST